MIDALRAFDRAVVCRYLATGKARVLQSVMCRTDLRDLLAGSMLSCPEETASASRGSSSVKPSPFIFLYAQGPETSDDISSNLEL